MGCRRCWPWGCWAVSTVRPCRPLPGQQPVPPPQQVALSCEGVGRYCWSCRTGCGQSSIRVAGPPPVAISNPGRIDPVDQRTGQALRTGGVLGAQASCDGIAFTHLSWAQTIPAGARMLSWRGDRPRAGSLVRVSGAVCPAWPVRERRTIERQRSACRPARPGSARSSTPCAQLSRRAVPEPCRKPLTRPIRGT